MKNERGQALIEYCLIAALVVITGMVALAALGKATQGVLDRTQQGLSCPNGLIEGPPPRCAP